MSEDDFRRALSLYQLTAEAGNMDAIVRRVNSFAVWTRGMPMLALWASIAAISAGVTGGIVGLVVSLFAYAPTAPFAAVELGFPATLAGGVVGLVAGTIMTAARCIRRHGANSP